VEEPSTASEADIRNWKKKDRSAAQAGKIASLIYINALCGSAPIVELGEL
jgi:hypothetical protein